jgi:type IV pilus assembly protein PilB
VDAIVQTLKDQDMLEPAILQTLVQEYTETGQNLLALIKRDNLLSEEQFVRLVAAGSQIEFLNLAPDDVEPMIAHLVSYELANRHTLIPIRRNENRLVVAMAAPLNLMVRDQIEIKTGYQVVPVAATPHAIRQAIHFHFDVANVTKQAIANMRLKEDALKGAAGAQDPFCEAADTEQVANDPITKLVSSILRGAIDAQASDVHIEPQPTEVRVRYRVDGMLRYAVTLPLSAQKEVVSHIKIVSNMDISEKRIPQDGHLALRHCGRDYDLRISSLPAMDGEKLVIRILDKSANRWDLMSIVSNVQDREEFHRLLSNPYGMLLVTGPTGSGKTTTLYSLLQLLNTPERNIVTVEDPVEYRLDGITQVQIRPQAGMTFASALRSILRQDPDIILIGEIRDLETAEIAVSSALTGHLVLSTLHTNDATGAISRLINLGIPPYLVGSALLGTVAQRLIRTLCPKCKKKYVPDPLAQDSRPVSGPTGTAESFYQAQGCPDCSHSGFKGRKSIYEILHVSHVLREMILENKHEDSLKERALREGMVALSESALREVGAGNTNMEEIRRVVEMAS